MSVCSARFANNDLAPRQLVFSPPNDGGICRLLWRKTGYRYLFPATRYWTTFSRYHLPPPASPLPGTTDLSCHHKHANKCMLDNEMPSSGYHVQNLWMRAAARRCV